MISALENLTGTGRPRISEPPDEVDIAGLLRSGRARLTDAGNTPLPIESRFDLAYNAAHASSLAALRRSGYRARHRNIVFQVLPHTLDLGPEVWRVLAKAHDQRNLAQYEGHLDVEDRLVRDEVQRAGSLRRQATCEGSSLLTQAHPPFERHAQPTLPARMNHRSTAVPRRRTQQARVQRSLRIGHDSAVTQRHAATTLQGLPS